MKRLHLLFVLSLALAAQAALAAPAGPQLTVGNRVFTDLSSNLIVLIGDVEPAGAQKYTTLRKIGATSGYQVTSGKTLTIQGCRGIVQTAGATFLQFGYGDTDVGYNSAAAPTNATDSTGAAFRHYIMIGNAVNASGTFVDVPFWDTVPSGKYPVMTSGAATYAILIQCFGTEN